jgi:hypothetical protein
VGFDDLAKHMAKRDRRTGSTSRDPDQIVAEAAEADRRMSRTRDLILGPILLVGGLGFVALFLLARVSRDAGEAPGYVWSYCVGGITATGVGARQTWRGLRKLRRSVT